MKNLIKLSISVIAIAGASFLATGCGLQRQVDNLRRDQDFTDARLDELEKQFSSMVNLVNSMFNQEQSLAAQINANKASSQAAQAQLQTQVTQQQASVAALQAQVLAGDAALQGQLDTETASMVSLQNLYSQAVALGTAEDNYLRGQLSGLQSQTASLQSQANSQQLAITTLNNQTTVSGMINPCGDGPGYDEVLMKLSDGQVIAYFEDDNKRHLSVLTPDTWFQTTDQQSCQFKVDASGNISYH